MHSNDHLKDPRATIEGGGEYPSTHLWGNHCVQGVYSTCTILIYKPTRAIELSYGSSPMGVVYGTCSSMQSQQDQVTGDKARPINVHMYASNFHTYTAYIYTHVIPECRRHCIRKTMHNCKLATPSSL